MTPHITHVWVLSIMTLGVHHGDLTWELVVQCWGHNPLVHCTGQFNVRYMCIFKLLIHIRCIIWLKIAKHYLKVYMYFKLKQYMNIHQSENTIMERTLLTPCRGQWAPVKLLLYLEFSWTFIHCIYSISACHHDWSNTLVVSVLVALRPDGVNWFQSIPSNIEVYLCMM